MICFAESVILKEIRREPGIMQLHIAFYRNKSCMRHLLLSGKIILACFLPVFAPAQQVIGIRSGLVNQIVGGVYLDGHRLESSLNHPYEVLDGMGLRTESGLAEIQLGAGAILRADKRTFLRMENTNLKNTCLRLEHGSVLIEIIQIFEDNNIRVHFRDARILFEREGLYRLDANESQLRVYGGKAVVQGCDRKVSAKSGNAVDLLTLSKRKFNIRKKDMFHYWAAYRSFNQNLQFLKMGWYSSHWKSLLMDCFQNEDYRVTFKDKEKEGSYDQEDRNEYERRQEMNDIIQSIGSLKNAQ